MAKHKNNFKFNPFMKTLLFIILAVFFWACSGSDTAPPKIEPVEVTGNQNFESIKKSLEADENNSQTTDQQSAAISTPKSTITPQNYNPVNGEHVTIQFESITYNDYSTRINFSVTNTKNTPQGIFITDIRLINRSKKILKASDVDNKWGIPGEYEQVVFDGKIDGWRNLENGMNYQKMSPNETRQVSITGKPIAGLDKYNYHLSITCNNENFFVYDLTN